MKRTTTEIIQNLLTNAKTPIHQLKLKQKTNISPQQFKNLAKKLIEKKQITTYKKSKRIYYKTTQKGIETQQQLIQLHRKLNNITRNLK